MTDAERALWRILRESFADWHFRRQVPIRHFIADFASHRAKLIIEVDGGQHEATIDAPRAAILNEEVYRVIRFWNNEVLGNPDGAWTMIQSALHDRHPTPTPPHPGEGLT
jgi:very-short-patch-repair endonuclease